MRKLFENNEPKALKNLLFSQNPLKASVYNFVLKYILIFFKFIFSESQNLNIDQMRDLNPV